MKSFFWGGTFNHGDDDVKVVRKLTIITFTFTFIGARVLLPRDARDFLGGTFNHGDNDVKVVRKAIIIPTLIRVRVLPRDV